MKRIIIIVGMLIASAALGATSSSRSATSARNGRIVFTATVRGGQQLFTINPDGTELKQLSDRTFAKGSDGFENPNWAPDGSQIIFDSDFQPTATNIVRIYTVNADGSGLTAVPVAAGQFDGAPAFSPDGREISFDWDANSNPVHPQGIDIADVDGTNVRRVTKRMTTPDGYDTNSAWSPDGRWLAFVRIRTESSAALFKVRVDGTGLKRLTPWSMDAGNPTWSPDGNRILFENNESSSVGRNANVFTIRPDGSGLVQLTHFTDGQTQGRVGAWSPDGKWIVWHRRGVDPNGPGANQLFIMNTRGGEVRQLTHLPHGANPQHANWGTLG
jgi:Tol biopolymer transport system component